MAKKIIKKPGRPRTMGICKMRSLRIPVEEWEAWSRTASDQGLSVTSWLREVCNSATAKRAKK